MKKDRLGTWLMLGGLLLIAAALCLAGANLVEDRLAGNSASRTLEQLWEQALPSRVPVETPPSSAPQASGPAQTLPTVPEHLADPSIPMPTVRVDGLDYVGVVEIPAIGVQLPVLDTWDYTLLKKAPCRFQGSAYLDNLIVMGHNYQNFFGALLELKPGDTVYFLDMRGNAFQYTVVELEVLDRNALDGLLDGQWDLTLFTCTIGAMSRVIVRCDRV